MPRLQLEPSRYKYDVEMDSGTGTAYLALVMLDLIILAETQLPAVVHDSLLFKNVEAQSIEQLFKRYAQSVKQIIIAIDETERYDSTTQRIIENATRLSLTRQSSLYQKQWGTSESDA